MLENTNFFVFSKNKISNIYFQFFFSKKFSGLFFCHINKTLNFFLVFASCLDGNIYEFSIGSHGKPRRAFQGHIMEGSGNNHVRIKTSPDKKYLISGSTDGYPRIYPLGEEYTKRENPLLQPITGSENRKINGWWMCVDGSLHRIKVIIS